MALLCPNANYEWRFLWDTAASGGNGRLGKQAARIILECSLILAAASYAAAQDVAEIVRRSVENNQRNWAAAPQFQFTEHDLITKGGKRTDRTYQVMMIDGSPYDKTIAVNGRPLSEAQARAEDEKLRREEDHRRRETPQERSKRIAEYEKGRRQDHALMGDMIRAFDFSLPGSEQMNGRECFRVDATPKPGYNPPTRQTKVLTGMKGTLWIDVSQYQWVRVKAAVFRPVSFGLFIAHVQPGTEFTLDEAPVEGGLWMPAHFRVQINASVLFWSRNSVDDETYTDYTRAPVPVREPK